MRRRARLHAVQALPPGKLQVMLDDKDRIFRNLYGLQDWSLEAARRRGAWDGTKAIIDKGRDWIINGMKASALRRRGALWINTDEPGLGTCKERDILRHDPPVLVKGFLLASFAMGARGCYIS